MLCSVAKECKQSCLSTRRNCIRKITTLVRVLDPRFGNDFLRDGDLLKERVVLRDIYAAQSDGEQGGSRPTVEMDVTGTGGEIVESGKMEKKVVGVVGGCGQ